MVYPGPPPGPRDRDRDRDESSRDPDDLDISLDRGASSDAGLTTVDWLLCIFCSGIACIVGIVRLIQGKRNAGKMIGVSLVFVVLWTMVRFVLDGMQRR